MQAQRLLWLIPLGLGLALTTFLLMVLSQIPDVAHASPDILYVAPDCTGISDCYTSIQDAVNAAHDGDTIYIAGGTYTSTGAAVITITKSITLYGGWDGTTATPPVRDPNTYPTTLDGENARRAVYITGTVTPTLEGLTLQYGDASGLGGDPVLPGADFGGAVYANNASPVITDCRILSSTAGFGGGLALYYGAPTMGNSAVLSNTASQDVSGVIRGVGGGIFLYHSPATIVSNMVMGNVASGTTMYDGGGGLYLDNSAAVIRSNTIQGNYGYPYGGGLFSYQSGAGVRGNTIQGNNAPNGHGGGMFMAMSAVDLEANTILNNGASVAGGGLEIIGSDPFTLTNNTVVLNFTQGGAPALFVAGYQPLVGPGLSSQGTLLHNTFVDNHSSVPWMIHVGTSSGPGATLAFTNTIIDKPGGIWVDPTGSVMLDTTLWDISLQGTGLTVTGTGTIISRTNLYGFPDFVWPTFHIGPNSLAIDQGTPAGVMTDIDGESRPNGAGYDIGADEFYCYALTGVTINGPTTGITNTAYAFTATVSPPTATLPVTYTWQATGQTPVPHIVYSLSDTAAFTWTIPGTQVVTVTAANCGGSDVETHTITIRLPQWTIYLPVILHNYP